MRIIVHWRNPPLGSLDHDDDDNNDDDDDDDEEEEDNDKCQILETLLSWFCII